jgi:hypothetical protein
LSYEILIIVRIVYKEHLKKDTTQFEIKIFNSEGKLLKIKESKCYIGGNNILELEQVVNDYLGIMVSFCVT